MTTPSMVDVISSQTTRLFSQSAYEGRHLRAESARTVVHYLVLGTTQEASGCASAYCGGLHGKQRSMLRLGNLRRFPSARCSSLPPQAITVSEGMSSDTT